MHASSLENMQKCLDRHVGRGFFDDQLRTVIDLGAADYNGSYRRLFEEIPCTYIGLDLQPGPGIDVVLEDPYQLPYRDESIDLVVSGQTFEHCEYFWDLFREMVRVLSPDGFLLLIAPSEGKIHRYPVDCYRFYPDAYAALARYAGCHAVAVWRDERGPWHDLVGVFSKNADAVGRPEHPPVHRVQNTPAVTDLKEAEVVAGEMPTHDVLRVIHAASAPRSYLEIGVRSGGSLNLAVCPSIGVDPEPDQSCTFSDQVQLFRMTSDFFFEKHAKQALRRPPDLVFIDGMHQFEFALRDFMNAERCAHAATVILIDDIFPNHPLQAERERRTRVWSGDVWKIVDCLRKHRPDLWLLPFDTSPAGLLMVVGADRQNRALWDSYNPIVAEYRAPSSPPDDVLARNGAIDPRSPGLTVLLREIAAARESRDSRRRIVDAAAQFVAAAQRRV
jgi:SAM-dependent methyltransferase